MKTTPFYGRSMRCAAGLISVLFAQLAVADDWPQWMGLNRDSVWRETGIVKQFPDSGLPVKWRIEVGGGGTRVPHRLRRPFRRGVLQPGWPQQPAGQRTDPLRRCPRRIDPLENGVRLPLADLLFERSPRDADRRWRPGLYARSGGKVALFANENGTDRVVPKSCGGLPDGDSHLGFQRASADRR